MSFEEMKAKITEIQDNYGWASEGSMILIYDWVKAGMISQEQFNELMDIIFKCIHHDA